MNNQVIAADYDNVKATIQKMEQEVTQVENSIKNVLTAVNNTTEWQGPDADAYKVVLRNYAKRIERSSRWLKALNKILSSHALALYERAVNDNSASNFR